MAGGELLIPTLVLLFAVDAKTAGALSLLVSLPTMLVAFFRYSRTQAFAVRAENRRFVVAMAAGSVVGSVAGGALVGVVSEMSWCRCWRSCCSPRRSSCGATLTPIPFAQLPVPPTSA